MKTIEQIAAEILVECGKYVEINPVKDNRKTAFWIGFLNECNGPRDYRKSSRIDPFADTLEGRRQSDAIEDWIYSVHEDLWEQSHLIVELPFISFKWRLDRIKWCLEQLRDEE